MMESNWVDVFPLFFLAGGGFLVFCLGGFWRARPQGLLFAVSLGAAIAAGIAAAMPGTGQSRFLEMVETGGYGRFFMVLICLITTLGLLFSYQYARIRNLGGDEFYGLLLLAGLGMLLVATALHWVIFFLGVEVLSIPLYVLIAIRKNEPSSNEAGVKYFVMGAVASAFLTFGIAMIYGVTGKMDILQSLSGGMPSMSTPAMFLGMSLILTGIGFKISMVPFHLWTPDVYQGAPAPVTAFLAAGSKVALFAALLRLTYYYSSSAAWTYSVLVFWMLAFLTMAVGNIAALTQSRVKRLLAYSSIAQMGYLLMALLAVRKSGVPAIMFYLMVYALMDLGAFGTIALLSAKEEDLDDLDHFRGLAYSHPWASVLLTVCLVSLAGLPPTGGFMGKLMLFRAVLEADFVWLAVLGIMTVIVSIYFYFKVIVTIFMYPKVSTFSVSKVGLLGRIAGIIVFVLIVGLGVAPAPVFDAAERAMSLLSLPH